MWHTLLLVFYIPGFIHGRSLRISNGKEADITKFPYQVLLTCKDGVFVVICGGALISKDAVLTAAHCVEDCDEDRLTVSAGITEFDNVHQHHVREILTHPKYTEDDVSNDIALVYLKQRLKFSDRIRPITIATEQTPGGTKGVVSGWGRTEKGSIPYRLRYADVKILSNAYCGRMNPLLDDTQICTDASPKGPCNGDSGGPLVANNVLVGIVTYGEIGCKSDFVRMYTNVYHYRKFIMNNIE